MKNNYSKNNVIVNHNILWFLIVLLLLFSGKSFSQSDRISSLQKVVENTEIPADKVQALCDLAWEFKYTDADKAYDYGKQAYDWIRDLENNSNTAELYVNIGYIFIVTKNDFNKGMSCLKKANRMSENMQDEKQAKRLFAKVQEGVGLINFKLHEYEIAIESYEYASRLYTQLSMGSNVSNCFHSLGMIYEKKGDKRKADIYYHRETANNKRLDSKPVRKNAIMPGEDQQMVKIEDMNDAFE